MNIGALDGVTVLRFAHAFTTGGGMERILADLDQTLLSRNEMRIIRLFIGANGSDMAERTEKSGRGELIMVPLPLAPNDTASLASDHEDRRISLRQLARNHILYNRLVWGVAGKRYVATRPLARRPGQVLGAGERAANLFERYPVDLCMMHFFGGADADEIIAQAQLRDIPVGLENHFSNDRFLNVSIRKHAMLAAGIAGMNALDVPSYLGARFVNLADGIDLSCFDRDRVRPAVANSSKAILFLPARIVRPKGQMDVVYATAELRRRGFDVGAVFAGRVDSSDFETELRREVAHCGLANHVWFLGELHPLELREWYASSTVLVFPTYHHEGLGRIIIEAQAMEVPVVAYATGGVREGILHGKTGYLVPTGNRERLVDSLAKLLEDPLLRQTMGAAGREFVAGTYSLDALARRHEEFYLSMMRQPASCRA